MTGSQNEVTPTVNVLYSFSTALGGDVGLVEYLNLSLWEISALIFAFQGILTSEHNLRGHWCSPLGWRPSMFPSRNLF